MTCQGDFSWSLSYNKNRGYHLATASLRSFPSEQDEWIGLVLTKRLFDCFSDCKHIIPDIALCCAAQWPIAGATSRGWCNEVAKQALKEWIVKFFRIAARHFHLSNLTCVCQWQIRASSRNRWEIGRNFFPSWKEYQWYGEMCLFQWKSTWGLSYCLDVGQNRLFRK